MQTTLLVPGPLLQNGHPRAQIIFPMTTNTSTFRLSVHCDLRPCPSEILCRHPWHCGSAQTHMSATLKDGLFSILAVSSVGTNCHLLSLLVPCSQVASYSLFLLAFPSIPPALFLLLLVLCAVQRAKSLQTVFAWPGSHPIRG